MYTFSESSTLKTFVKYLNWFDRLNTTITRKLGETGMVTRPVKGNGLWCCALLPTVLVLYSCFYTVSYVYSVVACVSVALLVYSILLIVFVSISSIVLRKPLYGGCVASSMISTLLCCILLGAGVARSLTYSLCAVALYSAGVRRALRAMPRAFTLGEAMVVMQAIVLTLLALLIDVLESKTKNPLDTVLYTVLSTVGLLVTALYKMTPEHRTWQTLTVLSAAGAAHALLFLHFCLGDDVIIDLVRSLFMERTRMGLVCAWALLSGAAAALVWARTRGARKADTAARKAFHVLAAAVFLSGVAADLELTRLAAGAAFSLLLLIEALRKLDVKPFSNFLEPAFNVYCDEKEVGGWALPPLYLLTALAGPLVLVPRGAVPRARPDRLAGVLAIGVGDSAASYVGSRYGRTLWRGTNKTVEGTVANFLSQVVIISALKMYGLPLGRGAVWRAGAAAAAAALTEATTDQVDNLVLPLVSILTLQLTDLLYLVV